MARVSSSLLKRRLDIAEIVRKQGEVKVDELSELLNVSGVTIRQDLTYLEQQGYLKRSFGGAIYVGPASASAGAGNKNAIQPIAISQDNHEIDLVLNCLNYINDGDTVFLGNGQLVRKLIPFLYIKKSLTLLVNDIEHAVLAKQFTQAEVVITGGLLADYNIIVDNKLLSFMLNQYSISSFIIEAVAINADNELTIENMELVKSYQQIAKNSPFTIALLPQRTVHDDMNSIGKLDNIRIAILSRSAVTEFHQQLLDCDFKQVNANKRSLVYENSL